MPRKLLAVTLTIVLVLSVGIQFVKVSDANPFMKYHTVKPIAGTIPAKVIITSPINNTVYFPNYATFADNITVSFFVTKPILAMWDTSIVDITYKIDYSETQYGLDDLVSNKTASGVPGVSEYNRTFIAPSLSPGNHRLTILAYGNVAKIIDASSGRMDIFTTNSSSTLYFTILDTIDPSSTPTVPEFPAILALTFLFVTSLAVAVKYRKKAQ